MSQSHGAGGIAWRDWSEDAFTASRSEDKPVLLTLGATWCHWCHVMDETAYSDPRVIYLVNSRFIPVRVDVDQRPDISLRYNQGTYPSVAFLTPDGEFLAGLPYTPADEMAAVLEQISSGESATELSNPAARAKASTNSGTNASVDAVLGRLQDLYDEEFGGFALEPKQPPWEALQFLLARYELTGNRSLLAMVESTLQGMWHGIYDRKDQGFFRYAVSRDWKVPHYEKMLVTNANLAMAYLAAFQITRKAIYRTAVDGILDYLLTSLFNPDERLFYASQDADEPFYQGSWKDRNASVPPPIDHTFYAGWNALAAQSLIHAGDVLNRPSHGRLGADILDELWSGSWSAQGGLSRRAGETTGAVSTLIDQVYFLRAWLARYQSTGRPEYLSRAVEIAATTQRIYGASEGGCYDTGAPQSFEAGFLRREQPVLDNSCWAEALSVLSRLTGEEKYGEQAAATLKVFEPVVPGKSYLGDHASRRMEEDEEALFLPAGSAWGRAKSWLTHGPVSMMLVGDATDTSYRPLHQAALRVHAPHKVALPLDIARDAQRIHDLGFPARRDAALYVCMGEQCLAPITTPQGVREMARSRPWVTE
ncbi:MAG: thioredoxin domain-containing protein [Chloroflexi bacterium]|nr:thioredoxin domain-containing protein [Chloroflexota bacterium]MYD47674.1 thioredoxin domain-containing protein [Chloroflexota bacterium]